MQPYCSAPNHITTWAFDCGFELTPSDNFLWCHEVSHYWEDKWSKISSAEWLSLQNKPKPFNWIDSHLSFTWSRATIQNEKWKWSSSRYFCCGLSCFGIQKEWKSYWTKLDFQKGLMVLRYGEVYDGTLFLICLL